MFSPHSLERPCNPDGSFPIVKVRCHLVFLILLTTLHLEKVLHHLVSFRLVLYFHRFLFFPALLSCACSARFVVFMCPYGSFYVAFIVSFVLWFVAGEYASKFIAFLSNVVNLEVLAGISNALSLKHGLSMGCRQSFSVKQIPHPTSVAAARFCRRFSILGSSFTNENQEFVIVRGGNAAGYAARTFVENGMADGRLCIVSKEAYAPYERPALTRAYLFPLDKKPARLPGFRTCVGIGGERQTPDWYKDKGIEMLYEDPVADIDIEKQTLTTNSGKLLKYGSLIIATGCTATRFPDKIGGDLPGVHYIRDVADANSLISSLEKAKKNCGGWRWLHWHGSCSSCRRLET